MGHFCPRARTWSLHHKAWLWFRLFSCEGCPSRCCFLARGAPRAPRPKAPSTRTRAKSCAVIAALGEICGLAMRVAPSARGKRHTCLGSHNVCPPAALEKRRFRCDGFTYVPRVGRDLNAKITVVARWVVAVGCSIFGQSVAGDAAKPVFTSCAPSSGRLGADATLATHAGRYQLTLVQRADAVDIGSARGTLTLYRQMPGLDALGSASTPLYGTADVDLSAVGAHRVGDIGSDAPDGPGVLVLEFVRDGARDILLRFGSAANRRDTMLYDGAYTVLEVREILADGFSGSWRSGSNSSRADGYFCAIRSLSRRAWSPRDRFAVIGGVRR